MILQSLNKLTKGGVLSDKGRWHHYLRVYDVLFYPFRDKEINLFEVGFYSGGSCVLWEKYFTNVNIRCIDIDPTCLQYYEYDKEAGSLKKTTLELMDANDLTQEYFRDFVPDIAIDDGSHKVEDQVKFIKTVYPVLREGGLLLVEDIADIDKTKGEFDNIGIPYKIVDSRRSSGMADDVLLIFKK